MRPLTPARWGDLEALFGERGASGGCWCMWWRQPGAEHQRRAGAGNRKALRSLVDRDQRPGLLAYVGGRPVGWCSVAPREQFPRLARSPNLRPVDDQPVWSVVCFFIDREHREQRVASALLDAAVAHAAKRGAALVEGYPVDPGAGGPADREPFTGLLSMFTAAGFEEVERRSAARPIVRRRLG